MKDLICKLTHEGDVWSKPDGDGNSVPLGRYKPYQTVKAADLTPEKHRLLLETGNFSEASTRTAKAAPEAATAAKEA